MWQSSTITGAPGAPRNMARPPSNTHCARRLLRGAHSEARDLSARRARSTWGAVSDRTRIVAPGPRAGTIKTHAGEILAIPSGWALLPPGDPALTGRVKKQGPSWTVQEKRGRKLFSRGVWAPAETIESIREVLRLEREDPAYARKLESAQHRRAVAQVEYTEE